MRRYIGIAVGLGLLLVLAATTATPALAQGPLKPVQAEIVNDPANPVPVTVVAPPPQTTVTCTARLGLIAVGVPIVTLNSQAADSFFVCSGGVTSIDVSRIVYTPDVSAALPGSQSKNITAFRATVTHRDDIGDAPGVFLAVSTDGAPDAVVVRPFRLIPRAAGSS